MATVWELITESSTLPEQNDFWEHVNNLGSGEGGGSLECGATADVDYSNISADVGVALSAAVEDVTLEANLQEVLSASVETEILIGEVCP